MGTVSAVPLHKSTKTEVYPTFLEMLTFHFIYCMVYSSKSKKEKLFSKHKEV
jgi:hypothetical protein